ncbi:hypothetical protein HYH02_011056 [Chlamydomonas schloesseri]|uniref:3-hydroxyacyl-CoA dehydrogenase NAD binding domain-containing protein n=1 Tax=Chlamydomonas schloesseri TaxID=2026947 RepID=A0A835TG65_9CHLO|nr:hypothetical protein HYH02_011056 [Chlamydomonas schloesseri]|eukprot:KAG2437676.1 hypothetical protein HYH02_011056 [Chlamydomonas schloesseri]
MTYFEDEDLEDIGLSGGESQLDWPAAGGPPPRYGSTWGPFHGSNAAIAIVSLAPGEDIVALGYLANFKGFKMKKGAMSQAAADAALARVTGALDYGGFDRADMVIEAVIEDIPLKQKIFADLEKACRPDAILSTNISTIDIELVGAKMAGGAAARRRLLGAHFFSPAHVMPLLEIVRTKDTGAQELLDTLALSAVIKKTPVVVGNCTGFAVNRVFFPYTIGGGWFNRE